MPSDASISSWNREHCTERTAERENPDQFPRRERIARRTGTEMKIPETKKGEIGEKKIG